MLKKQYADKLSQWKALVRQESKEAKTALSPAHRLREIAEIEAELLPHLPQFRQGQTVADVTVTKVTTTDLPVALNVWAVGHEYKVTDGKTTRGKTTRWVGEGFLSNRQEALA